MAGISYQRALGTCYYPEHWPQSFWQKDAKAMVDAGIGFVRIGDFAWCLMEPERDKFQWDWLDKAVEVLGSAGLKIVMTTPTATPPRWLLDDMPDILAVDQNGHFRKFGSRRHYCFSHQGYRRECERIVRALAQRYGSHPDICAWQTDNEYGCHDTTLSFSNAAKDGFRRWLEARYGDISRLNEAWGNVFWSMVYNDFDQIDLPNMTVTEANPSHQLAFRRFSSDQVISFNRLQTDIIRKYSTRPISHNFMGRVTDFDHYKVGDDLDFATWNSYPVGFLKDRIDTSNAHKRRFMCQGDPDFQAFHHDLYRSVGKGRWWIMEQQPGPVNWASYNPAPLTGMVRLWSWEAFAHGAEVVSYFRWRQAPFAQEQLHSGLQHPDGTDAPSMAEIKTLKTELEDAKEIQPFKSDIALIFDYDSDFGWDIQPHGEDLSYFNIVFSTYKTLRKLGQSINIISPEQAAQTLSSYKMICAPGLLTLSNELKHALARFEGIAVLGPRTGVKTDEFQTLVPLGPALSGLDVKLHSSQSLPPDMAKPLKEGGHVGGYREKLSGTFDHKLMQTQDGCPVVVGQNQYVYCSGLLDETAEMVLMLKLFDRVGIRAQKLPEGLRLRETGQEQFWFNYNDQAIEFNGMSIDAAGVRRFKDGVMVF